ncbi:hypothetical protein M0R04_08795 [Candidatus Dojkabacteria bacterium]|jgi:hypothetical protein|nr:hypothetical protein [Candidatus Dojkabacteria bacterium]
MTKTNPIKEHEQKYWHIPKFRVGLISLLILILAIDFGYSFIFINEWNNHNITLIFKCSNEECRDIKTGSLDFIPQIFFAYFLISLTFIIITSLINGNELKTFDKTGLIWGFIIGLIAGGIVGSIVGLIRGLTTGSIAVFVWGVIGGLIIGLTLGFVGGLFMSFEFNRNGK